MEVIRRLALAVIVAAFLGAVLAAPSSLSAQEADPSLADTAGRLEAPSGARPDSNAHMDPASRAFADTAGAFDPSGAAGGGVSSVAEEGPPLGPGDGLKIVFYRHTDISGDYPVDENGDLLLPLIDKVNVLGKPIPALRSELVERYSGYLRTPSIRITPVYRINVMGEVRQPGLYPVDLTMSLSDVLALAGGLTPEGSMKKVKLLRSGQEMKWDLTDLRQHSRRIGEFGLRSGDEIVVGERSKNLLESLPFIATVVGSGATLLLLVTK